jgi:Holliday junction resolvase
VVNSRQKGAVGENKVKEFLESKTPYTFERTPGSGSGSIKGDLYIPKGKNVFCIEVKNYAESPFNDKILTSKTNDFVQWWIKLNKQSGAKKPLLFFRYNRSKLFVATDVKPTKVEKYIDIPWLNCYVMLSEEWIEKEEIKWLHLT